METLLYILGPLVGYGVRELAHTYFNAKQKKAIEGLAKELFDTGQAPDLKEAVKEAYLRMKFKEIEKQTKKLDELVAQGKRDELAAIARGKANAALVTTEVLDNDTPTDKPKSKTKPPKTPHRK